MNIYDALFKHLKLNLECPANEHRLNLEPQTLRLSTLSNIILNHFDLFEFKLGTPTLEILRTPTKKITIYLTLNSIRLAQKYDFNKQTVNLHNLNNIRESNHKDTIFSITKSNSYGEPITKFEYIPISNIIYICEKRGLTNIFEELNTALLFLLQLHNSNIVISKDSMRLPPQIVQETIIDLIEKLALDKALEKLKTVGYTAQVSALLKIIKGYSEEQVEIDRYIKEAADKLEIIERRHLFGQVSNLAEDLRDLLQRHTLLDHLEVNSVIDAVSIQIHTHPLSITKYDKGYLMKSLKRVYPNAPTLFKHAFNEFAEENATINLGKFILLLTINSNGLINIAANSKSKMYNNPHNKITCLGTYQTPMTKLRQDQKPIEMILLMLEYIQSINFKDSGSHDLPRMCYITNKKGDRIYDANPNNTEESPIENNIRNEEVTIERANVAGDIGPFAIDGDATRDSQNVPPGDYRDQEGFAIGNLEDPTEPETTELTQELPENPGQNHF